MQPPQEGKGHTCNVTSISGHVILPPYPARGQLWAGDEFTLVVVVPMQNLFSTTIQTKTLLVGVKMTNLTQYDRTEDPQEHLDKFYANKNLYDLNNVAYSNIYITTLMKQSLN